MKFVSKDLLAIEVAGDDIRAALVRGSGKNIEIIDFAAMKKADPEDDLPSVEAVKAIAERLRCTGGPAVFVTPMARTFELRMDLSKYSVLKSAQLREAVRWEVEPYTGITGGNALVGVQPAAGPEARPGEIVYEDDEDQAVINVSAIERNVYRAVKERFRVAGFSLRRIYPPDVTFYVPLLMDQVEAPRAILEVGRDYSNFAVVRGREPELISTLTMRLVSIGAHLCGELVSRELEDSLRFMARQVPAPEPLIISGPGAAVPSLVEYISGFCANGARPLVLSRIAGITDARTAPEHAVYGAVAGAAVRERLGRGERALGIDDEVSLSQRLRKSAYLFPVAVTALTIIALFGHYGFMRYKETSYRKRIATMNGEIKERKAKIAEYEKLIKEEQTVGKKIDEAKRRLAYVSGQADGELRKIVAAIRGVGAAVSDRVVLSSIAGTPDGGYLVTGGAAGQGAVGRFTTALQRQGWCRSAVLQKAERGESDDGFLTFEILVKTVGAAS